MWNISFFKILWFSICFFIFLLFLTFYFQFQLSVLVNKFYKFLCCFILWIREFIKEFGKSWNIFLKTIDIWNPKFFINSTVYYLFFFFWHFGNLFFLFHLSKLVKKFKTFLWYFIVRIYEFIRELRKVLEFLLKKMEIL